VYGLPPALYWAASITPIFVIVTVEAAILARALVAFAALRTSGLLLFLALLAGFIHMFAVAAVVSCCIQKVRDKLQPENPADVLGAQRRFSSRILCVSMKQSTRYNFALRRKKMKTGR